MRGYELIDGELLLTVTVPSNTTADIRLPNGNVHEVGAGTFEYRSAAAPDVQRTIA